MRAGSMRRRRRQARLRTFTVAVMRSALIMVGGVLAVTALLFVASLAWALLT